MSGSTSTETSRRLSKVSDASGPVEAPPRCVALPHGRADAYAGRVALPHGVCARVRQACGVATRGVRTCTQGVWRCHTGRAHVYAGCVALPHGVCARVRRACDVATRGVRTCTPGVWRCHVRVRGLSRKAIASAIAIELLPHPPPRSRASERRCGPRRSGALRSGRFPCRRVWW